MTRHFSPASILRGCVLATVIAQPALCVAQESFRVELGRDGETLGDMRPVFLKFESRPLPAISPMEVARRYQKLFESSDEPEVRIDALNRLNNIRDRSGKDVGFSEQREAAFYKEALESYESILAKGSFSGRLDELLYQMAKAHALTGQPDQSIARLKQLIGLYPGSDLVPEARFRVAEAAFSAGRYQEAESGYRRLLTDERHPVLAAKARYMLGWSQFKQGDGAWLRAAATFMDVLDRELPGTRQSGTPPASALEMLEDTLRVLAVMASRQGNADSLADWLANRSGSAWPHLLYDRLADLHAAEKRFERAVSVNDAFVARYPDHPARPDFLAQSVTYWQLAGASGKARAAREHYVQQLSAEAEYQSLSPEQKARWHKYSRFLADHYYAAGSELSSQRELVAAREAWAAAATYYERLAPRSRETGALLHLAADAQLLSGHRSGALVNFQASAYQHRHEKSGDSAWAAVRILRDDLDLVAGDDRHRQLERVSDQEQRYTNAFGPDARLSQLRADLANRWYEEGESDKALLYAARTLDWEDAGVSERYAAWLVTARVRQQAQDHALAEQAWRQALELAEQLGPASGSQKEHIREQIATSVYHQGDDAVEAGQVRIAVAHYQRVEHVLPGSEIAINARYDAANALLKAADWLAAINELNRFRDDYPKHELTPATSEKLVLAYRESGQGGKAAAELLRRAEQEAVPWPTRLRAAAIYHDEGDTESRNQLYRGWLAAASPPEAPGEHLQQQKVRQRLIESGGADDTLRHQLLARERASQWHSEETLLWAAEAALYFGARASRRFMDIPLIAPLERSLTRKQAAMREAQDYLEEAESFAGKLFRSEVLFRRAELYRVLARDLMASDVPEGLNELEAMQYKMLLEEEAFPLEEQAMALHSQNHERIPNAGFDEWIQRSMTALATLHPGRYQREFRWMSWATKSNPGET
ncbi:outer membrane protein assembly factor BamD [Marinobacter daepoensis]|uniref:Outer membrane protein assembly factor BamD n=1 Tax=Marinobacter daepoensis TaxID=262077 RepID=A0ABS3BAR7_9GAMM|nr:outer membrane protein assembly factor BamD [Marinobacter daepoensis]MBN7768908.1 outer membrane protein assembly factor BamD [Marinobacter daepoensis]MBY6077598.1 outer membrane protein assembly factor BamD [Marinobacter daepoensis]